MIGSSLILHAGSVRAADEKPASTETATAAPAAWVPEPGSEEEALYKRADAYWNAVVNRGDIAPFFPANADGRRWVDNAGLGATEYTIEGVAVEGNKGYVVVRSKMRPTGKLAARMKDLPDDIKQSLVNQKRADKWQRIDGTWYRKRSRNGLSRFMGARPAPEADGVMPADTVGERKQEEKTDQQGGKS